METEKILQDFKEGKITLEEAADFFKMEPYTDLGYAKIDNHRKIRQGYSEIIFCQGKNNEHLLEIFGKIYQNEGAVMGTRATKEQAELIIGRYPMAKYDEVSGVICIDKEKELIGKICVLTAGTADISVAEEAAKTAEFLGNRVERIYDVGVCGIHRLLSNMDRMEGARCIVAVAGMEGALASVIAGLVDIPVIAVPTSVGYGANFKGLSALLTMINSCANGVAVVNIDNGYGAGYMAATINRMGVYSE